MGFFKKLLRGTKRQDSITNSLQKCGEEKEVFMQRKKAEAMKCAKCKELYDVLAEKDLTDEVLKIAEEMGTDVEMVSADTKEGNQLKEMGGIGGVLRYKS